MSDCTISKCELQRLIDGKCDRVAFVTSKGKLSLRATLGLGSLVISLARGDGVAIREYATIFFV